MLLISEGIGVALGSAPAAPEGRLVCGQVSSFSGNVLVLKESHRSVSYPSNE